MSAAVTVRPGDMDIVNRLRLTHESWVSEPPTSVRKFRDALGNCNAEKAKRIMSLFLESVNGNVPVREDVPVVPPVQNNAVPSDPVPDWVQPVPHVPPARTTPVRKSVPPVQPVPVQAKLTKTRKLGYFLEEMIGIIPPLAALIVAGILETQLTHHALGWDYSIAWGPAAAIEGATVYLAILRDRHIAKNDNTGILSVGILAFAITSCVLVGYHVHKIHAPMPVVFAMGMMAAASAFLWGRRAAWKKREARREHGLIRPRVAGGAHAPQFNGERWLVAFAETFRIYRWAIKNGISDTDEAVDKYRAFKDAQRAAKAAK